MDTQQYSREVQQQLKKHYDTEILPNWSEKLDSEELIREEHITPVYYKEFLLKSMVKKPLLCIV